jgi:hypothetical protein
MRYIGSLGGYGTLTWSGSGSCAVQYDIEGFYQDRGDRIKASGQVRGLTVAMDDLADRSQMRLALDDGRELDIAVVPRSQDEEAGTLDIEVMTALSEFTDKKPQPRPGRERSSTW